MILDTGNEAKVVGELFHHQGFLNLVGIDILSGMLNEVKKKMYLVSFGLVF